MKYRLIAPLLGYLLSYGTVTLAMSFDQALDHKATQHRSFSEQQVEGRIIELKNAANALLDSNPMPMFQGVAYQDNDQHAYTESHYQIAPHQILVLYHEPNNALFAIKRLDFDNGATASSAQLNSTPDVEQINFRQGEYIASVFERTTNHRHLHYRAAQDDEIKYQILTRKNADDQLVIDAGFDRLIQQRWPSLVVNGGAFDYLLLPQQSTFRLMVEHTGCPDASNTCFRVTADNWLLSMISQPLSLEYDGQKRLKSFVGKSNISDSQGDYPRVRIQYQHNR